MLPNRRLQAMRRVLKRYRVTNRPAATKGWLGQNANIDAAHRVHARVEDAYRTGKDAGLATSYPNAKSLPGTRSDSAQR
jgi:hypothetical protein